MSFVVSKLLWGLVQPLNLIVTLLAVGIILGLIGFRTMANRALWAGIGLLLAISFLPLADLALVPLENRFPQPAPLPAKIDGIILLGGAGLPDLALARDEMALNDAAERYTEVFALARRYPDAKVIFTGGSARVFEGGAPEAGMAQRLFAQQGFAPDRVIFETQSRNTWENAIFSRRLVAPVNGQTWLLVTSAYHMPRSVGIFRQVVWPGLVPYPVDFRTNGRIDIVGSNFLVRLNEFDLAIREWIGLVAYRLMGRTNALYPGPA